MYAEGRTAGGVQQSRPRREAVAAGQGQGASTFDSTSEFAPVSYIPQELIEIFHVSISWSNVRSEVNLSYVQPWVREEEVLRRCDQHFFKQSSNVLLYREVPGLANGGGGLGDKEMMILLQQRKIAALDEANNRLVR